MAVGVLEPFACSDAPRAFHVEATATREAGKVILEYRIQGHVSAMMLPPLAISERRDELWKHTCAELFVAATGQPGYCEFNFSPSTQWAAYEFDDYRAGMRVLEVEAPCIAVSVQPDAILIKVICVLPPIYAESRSLQAGITLVLEDQAGQISYWALAHPVDKPDFHHRAGLVLEL